MLDILIDMFWNFANLKNIIIFLFLVVVFYKFIYKVISSDDYKKYFAIFILLSFILIFIVFYINIIIHSRDDDFKLGEFGDFAGGVLNPILAFFSFICLLATIILQQKELKMSREELELTREELEEQGKTFEKQKEQMELQTFDNKFFNMLEMFSHVRGSVLNTKIIFEFLSPDGVNNFEKLKILLYDKLFSSSIFIDSGFEYFNNKAQLKLSSNKGALNYDFKDEK